VNVMTKKRVKFCFVLLCVVLLSTFAFRNMDALLHTPFAREIAFENISKAIMDEEKNIILLDKSLQRILKIRQDGSLVFEIDAAHQHQTERDHLPKDLAVDSRGNLYVLQMVLDPNEAFVEGEEIVRYSPEGRFEQVVYRLHHEEGKRVERPGRLQELRFENGELLFYDWDGSRITLKSLALESREESTLFQVNLPFDPYIAYLSGMEDNLLLYTTKRAELVKHDSGGMESTLLYRNGDSEETREAFPVYLDYEPPFVYVVDIGRKEVIRLNHLTGEKQVLTSTDQLRSQGYDISLTSTTSIRVTDGHELILTVGNSVLRLNQDGTVKQVYDSARIEPATRMFIFSVWGAAATALLLVLYLLRLVYVDWMKRRMPVLFKQILVFTPILFSAMVLTAGFVYENLLQKMEEEIYNKLKIFAHLSSTTLDKEKFLALERPADFKGSTYNELEQRYLEFLQGIGLDREGMYASLYRVENGRMYVMMYSSESVGTWYPVEIEEEYKPLLENGEILALKSGDADGEWMFVMAPIYSGDQELVGIQEVGITLANFNEYKRDLLWSTLRIVAILSPLLLAVFLVMTYILLSSIRKLRNSVVAVASGNWDTRVNIRTRDEVEELGHQFNLMARYIRKYVADLNHSSEAYFRFVPQQFLQCLGKECILDVQLGDQKEADMTIFIAKLQSFSEMSRGLSSEENFQFLNAVFKKIGPVIREHEGFVSRYLPSGIFALFPEKPIQAVHAAIAILQTARRMNDSQSDAYPSQPADVAIAIHRGPVMLGIIGEEKRMESGVISEHATIASVLEKKAKLLGAQILVSDSLEEELASSGLNYRALGLIFLEEQRKSVRLYDVFEGDPDERRSSKLKTRTAFEEAVRLYQQGRFHDARERFVQILRMDRDDQAAKLYFYAAELFGERGADAGFDGALPVQLIQEAAVLSGS